MDRKYESPGDLLSELAIRISSLPALNNVNNLIEGTKWLRMFMLLVHPDKVNVKSWKHSDRAADILHRISQVVVGANSNRNRWLQTYLDRDDMVMPEQGRLKYFRDLVKTHLQDVKDRKKMKSTSGGLQKRGLNKYKSFVNDVYRKKAKLRKAKIALTISPVTGKSKLQPSMKAVTYKSRHGRRKTKQVAVAQPSYGGLIKACRLNQIDYAKYIRYMIDVLHNTMKTKNLVASALFQKHFNTVVSMAMNADMLQLSQWNKRSQIEYAAACLFEELQAEMGFDGRIDHEFVGGGEYEEEDNQSTKKTQKKKSLSSSPAKRRLLVHHKNPSTKRRRR